MNFADLARLAGGYTEARILQAAVSLGVFDGLNSGARDAQAIASSIHTDPRATELLLNALAALGLLEKKDRFFSLSEVSSTYLVQGAAKYFAGMVLFDSSLWSCWGALEDAVRSGKPARVPDMYQQDPAETERFIQAMHSLVEARGDAQVLTERLDLSGVQELLDVGSGPGTYLIHFCRKYPGLRATVFDLPGTLKITEKMVQTSEVKDRIQLVSGDYRTNPIPGKYQMIFLSNIIHAESSAENFRLMAKLYPRLEPGGRIVIKDHILDDTLTDPPAGAVFALLMLLTTGYGRCYSFNEVRAWLKEAGFGQVSQVSLPSPLTSSLVIGVKE